MLKKTFKIFLAVTLLFFLSLPVFAQKETDLELNFFGAPGCPYCEKEKIFLGEIAEKYPDLKINIYSLSEEGAVEKMMELINKYPGSEKYLGSVPITFLAEEFFVGFSEEKGLQIENSIKNFYQRAEEESEENTVKDIFSLPFLGEIDPQGKSLFVLAAVIGLIDGLNICSLGALILILVLVLALESRRMTFIFGGLFILITILVYGFLIFLWHQIFSFIVPYMSLIKIIIGGAALFGGFYFFKQFLKFRKQGPACEMKEGKIISTATRKLEDSFKQRKNFLFLLGAVILFAAVVTIIEFPCSAVFPVVFTGILAQANLSFLTSIFYMTLYLLFYMLIAIVIFLTAVFTKKIWIASGRVMTWISLIGALLLFFLSYYYLFMIQ